MTNEISIILYTSFMFIMGIIAVIIIDKFDQ
jgi:hypothetical protein